MKNFTSYLLFILIVFFGLQIHAQKKTIDIKNVSSKKIFLNKNKNLQKSQSKKELKKSNQLLRTVSVLDSVEYHLGKATGLSSLSINNATSAHAFAQYFDAPSSLTINGVSFYAFKQNNTGGSNINVSVEVYAAASDSIPTGSALATTLVNVDDTFGTGSLAELIKHATFSNPVTVTQPYCIVITNNSPNGVGFVANSYSDANGGEEWLSSLNIGGNWLRSYDINVGGNLFDADFLTEPHVSYNIIADFTLNPPINSGGNMVEVTSSSTSDSFLEHRMYNTAAFLETPNFSYTFDFGDGSPIVNSASTTYTYSNNNAQNITLTNTLFGWTGNFEDTITKPWNYTLGVDETVFNEFSVYPNPVTSKFYINTPNGFDIKSINVYNVSGKKVLTTINTEIHTNSWSSGLYFVNISSDNETIIKRLIKY